ncbi:hypothetical protein ACFXAO_09025 [Streptomyces lavendulae]|uniref:hypothetical protein n=1 Tax=Streptomyces lavendulae TaxID=1914 RepID=UPI0036B447B0
MPPAEDGRTGSPGTPDRHPRLGEGLRRRVRSPARARPAARTRSTPPGDPP